MFQRLRRGGWPYSQPPNVDFEVNLDSEQSEGLVLWMPWGGGTPGAHRHVDRIGGLAFTEGGTPVWVADGERGWSMLFDDGANEYLEIDQAPVIAPPFTLTAWFRADDDTVATVVLFLGDKDVGGERWALRARGADGGDPCSFYVDGVGSVNVEPTTGFTINTWHHLCGVEASSTDHRAYIDGGSKSTDATDLSPAGADRVSIGRFGDNTPSEYFSGKIGDVRIYDVVKTDEQVYRMYANPWELYRPRVRWWAGWALAAAADAMPMAMDLYRRRRAA